MKRLTKQMILPGFPELPPLKPREKISLCVFLYIFPKKEAAGKKLLIKLAHPKSEEREFLINTFHVFGFEDGRLDSSFGLSIVNVYGEEIVYSLTDRVFKYTNQKRRRCEDCKINEAASEECLFESKRFCPCFVSFESEEKIYNISSVISSV